MKGKGHFWISFSLGPCWGKSFSFGRILGVGGTSPLKDMFLRLFLLASNPHSLVADNFDWLGNGVWYPRLRRNLNDWEWETGRTSWGWWILWKVFGWSKGIGIAEYRVCARMVVFPLNLSMVDLPGIPSRLALLRALGLGGCLQKFNSLFGPLGWTKFLLLTILETNDGIWLTNVVFASWKRNSCTIFLFIAWGGYGFHSWPIFRLLGFSRSRFWISFWDGWTWILGTGWFGRKWTSRSLRTRSWSMIIFQPGCMSSFWSGFLFRFLLLSMIG